MKLTMNDLLEGLAEAIRQRRQSYVKPFDLSAVNINNDENKLEFSVLVNGTLRHFDLMVIEVSEARRMVAQREETE